MALDLNEEQQEGLEKVVKAISEGAEAMAGPKTAKTLNEALASANLNLKIKEHSWLEEGKLYAIKSYERDIRRRFKKEGVEWP